MDSNQRTSHSRVHDGRSQPRGNQMNHYLNQAPEEDGVTWLIPPTSGASSEGIRAPTLQRQITHVNALLMGDNASVNCPYSFAGCPDISPNKLSWINHVRFRHLEYSCPVNNGACGEPFNNTYHTENSEFLFSVQQRQCPPNMRCTAVGCGAQFRGDDALELWLDHVYMHLECLAIHDRSQTFRTAIEGNPDFIQWSSSLDIGIIRKNAPDGSWTLCQCLFKLQLDPSLIDDTPGSQLPLQPESLAFNPNSSFSAHNRHENGTFATYQNQGFGYPTHYIGANHSINHGLSGGSFDVPFRPHDNSSFNERREDGYQTTSGNSFSSVPVGIDEVHSHASLSTTHPDFSISHDGVSLHSSWSLQASGSPLDNLQLADFAISFFQEVLNYQENVAESNSDNQETTQNYGSEEDSSRGRSTIARDERKPGSKPSYYCPWYARNPSIYGHGKWACCAHTTWDAVRRVREHGRRRHFLPSNLCGRCLEDFNDAEGVQQHQESQHQGPLCPKKENSPYLMPDEEHLLEVPSRRGMHDDEKWRCLYGNLFPGEQIPNPYRIDHKMKLFANIKRVLRTPGINEDKQQTFRRIMNVTLQAIYSISPQRRDGVENALAILRNIAEHAQEQIVNARDQIDQSLSAIGPPKFRPCGGDVFMGAM